MKNLSKKEFEEAPKIIHHIYCMSAIGVPVGASIYEEAIEKHPEYFPKEVEAERKWKSVPQDVKDSYFKELNDSRELIMKDLPHNNEGIEYWVNNPKEWKEREAKYDELFPLVVEKEKELHKKHFSKYGIKMTAS